MSHKTKSFVIDLGRLGTLKSKKTGLIALAAAFGFSGLLSNELGIKGIAAALANPLAIFESRSPGARTSGQLTQTKLPRRKPFIPHERVKSQVRTHRVPPGDLANIPPEGLYPPLSFGPPVIDIGGGFNSTGSFSPYPFGDGGVIGAPVGGSLPASVTTPIAPSVPEPATWMTLIVGVLMIGASLRSQRAAKLRHVLLEPADNVNSNAFTKPHI